MTHSSFSESRVRDFLRHCLRKSKNQLDWIEQAHGSTVGYPDAIVQVGGNCFIPVECKFWLYDVKDSRLLTTHLRPSQIRWHCDARRAGIRSALLVGSARKQGEIEYRVIDPMTIINDHSSRFDVQVGKCAVVHDGNSLFLALTGNPGVVFKDAMIGLPHSTTWWAD